MTRITTLQNEIYKAHKRAWENDTWDFPDNVTSKDQISQGKTSKFLWNYVVENNVSITSQLIMSDKTFKYLTGVAQKEIREGFKKVLRGNNIK